MPDLQLVVDIRNQVDGLDQEIAQLDQMRGKVDELNASAATGIDLAEQNNVAASARTEQLSQQALIEAQLQTIAGTRLALVQAQIEGDTAQAAILKEELAVRTSVLGVLRAETLSQSALNSLVGEEAALLAAAGKEAQGTAAGALLTGVNLSKARQEAMVLARELAVGNVRASTTGSLLGSLGTPLTIAGIAAYTLFEIIKKSGEEAAKLEQELVKQSEGLDHAIAQWTELAAQAQKAGDVYKLGEKAIPELDAIEKKLDELREKELTVGATLIDSLVENFKTAIPGVSAGTGPNQKAVDDAIANLKVLQQQGLATANTSIDAAQASEAAWDKMQLKPPMEAIDELSKKLAYLEMQQDQVDRRNSTPDLTRWVSLGKQIETVKKQIEDLVKAEQKQENEEDQSKAAAQHREINELLKQEETTLQKIRQDQEIINKNPVMGAGDKEAALHTASLREQATVETEILKIETEISKLKGIGDPQNQAQVEQLTQKLNALRTQYQLLGFEIQKTTFTGAIKSDLQNWVNSWGSASHQIAQTIQQSIGGALQQLNQYIVTGKFNAQALLQQFEMLGLQLIEQLLMQRVMSAINASATATQAAITGPLVAAAWAPAATAVSVASYGAADVAGTTAYLEALAVIGGASVAHEGAVVGEGNETRLGGGSGRPPLGRKLSPNEQFVLALQGEGIFTEHQMDHLVPTRTDVFSSEQLSALGVGAGSPITSGIRPEPGTGPSTALINQTFHGPPAISKLHSGGIVVAHDGAIVGYTKDGTPLTQAQIDFAIDNRLNPWTLPPEFFGYWSASNDVNKYGQSGSDLGGGIEFPPATGPGSDPRFDAYGNIPAGGVTVYGGGPTVEIPTDTGGGPTVEIPTDPFGGSYAGGDPGYDPFSGAMAGGGYYVDPFTGAVIDASTGQPISSAFAGASAAGDAGTALGGGAGQPGLGPGEPVYPSAPFTGGIWGGSAGWQTYTPYTGGYQSGSTYSFDPYGSAIGTAPTFANLGGGQVNPKIGMGNSPDQWGSTTSPVGKQQATEPGLWGGNWKRDDAYYSNPANFVSQVPLGFQFNLDTGTPQKSKHSGGAIDGSKGSEVDIRALVGEHVMQIPAVDHYGQDTMDAINSLQVPINRIKLHDGGPVGSPGGGSPSGGGGGGLGASIHVFSFTDLEALRGAVINSDANKKFIVDTVSGRAHELGLGGA